MKTTVQALRDIYTAMGGTSTDITDNMTIPEALVKIAAVAPAIPAIKKTDEGKVLKVDSNGKWSLGTDEIQA